MFVSHRAVNMLLLGVGYQGGQIALSAGAIGEAIRLNGAEVDRNVAAFAWGRKYYHDARSVEEILDPPQVKAPAVSTVEHRASELREYQNGAYADRYTQFVQGVSAREPALAEPVARYLYKLMADKDEYEVARVLAESSVERPLGDMWEQGESIGYNLHPPPFRALAWTREAPFARRLA